MNTPAYTAARPDEYPDQECAADGARDVRRGQHRDTGYPPGQSDGTGGGEGGCHACREERCQRETREVDGPWPGGTNAGRFSEPVAIETPHQLADDLAQRRDSDDGERLHAHFRRLEHEECREDSGRQDAERELARVLHVPIDHETADGPGADDEKRDEREAAHRSHLRRCIGEGSRIGSPQSSQEALSWHLHASCPSKVWMAIDRLPQAGDRVGRAPRGRARDGDARSPRRGTNSALAIVFDSDDDYATGNAALSAMPAGDTPGRRTSVTKYDVVARMTS